MAARKIALRHKDYDGKGSVHYLGCRFVWGKSDETLDDMRTFANEAIAKRTNEFKYYGFECVPVEVSIKILDN